MFSCLVNTVCALLTCLHDIILIPGSQICSGLALVRDVTKAMTSIVQHVTTVLSNRYNTLDLIKSYTFCFFKYQLVIKND